jgi:Stage II sporulation protein M
MKPSELALAQGMDVTRATLRRWNAAPGRVVVPWALGSLAVAVAMLLGVWAVGEIVTPDDVRLLLPGINEPAGMDDVARVIGRNALVLALHAMACVAGFIAGSSLPLQAAHKRGVSRWVHDHAGPAAIAFVGAATLFSLVTQVYVLGSDAATIARQLGIGPGMLLLTLLPHALPELIALFLPLAAWLVASRRGRWDELLAATVATMLLAVPVVLLAAHVEIFVWPHLLQAASPLV